MEVRQTVECKEEREGKGGGGRWNENTEKRWGMVRVRRKVADSRGASAARAVCGCFGGNGGGRRGEGRRSGFAAVAE